MPAVHLAAALRHLADAAERERDAMHRWLMVRGRPGREILDRRHCMVERRELVQAHENLGRRLSRPPPHGCSELFLDAVHRLRQWHAQHTPLPELLDVEDLQFVGTAARVMGDEVGKLEADLPDQVLASLGTPLTETERAVLNVIKTRSPEGIMGKEIVAAIAPISIKLNTLTRHIIPKLKELRGVENRRGAGYYIPT